METQELSKDVLDGGGRCGKGGEELVRQIGETLVEGLQVAAQNGKAVTGVCEDGARDGMTKGT